MQHFLAGVWDSKPYPERDIPHLSRVLGNRLLGWVPGKTPKIRAIFTARRWPDYSSIRVRLNILLNDSFWGQFWLSCIFLLFPFLHYSDYI